MRILHYATPGGREPVRESIEELPLDTRFEVLALFRRLENGEQIPMPHSRSLASITHGLHELRIRDPQGQLRIFYYVKVGDAIYLIHVIRKKSRVIGDRDRAIILRRIREVTA